MHIIIGGAYNGKRNYVENLVEEKDVIWCHGSLTAVAASKNTNITLVISGVEKMFEHLMSQDEVAQAINLFEQIKEVSSGFNEVYIIVKDMGRGIVPVEAEQRKLRDVLGRLYQLLMQEAKNVTRIWYGIPQQIK